MPTRYAADQYAFSKPSAQAEYWAGFIMADGCVQHSGDDLPRLVVSLKRSDAGHLRKLRDFLQCENPVKEYEQKSYVSKSGILKTSRLTVRSRQIVSDLLKMGITPRKSLTATAPPMVADSRDFWRGVIDGDGTVAPPNGYRMYLSLCSCGRLAHQFHKHIKSVLGINGRLRQAIKPGRAVKYYAEYIGVNAAKVANYLYRDGDVGLDRKQANASHWRMVFSDIISGKAKRLARGTGPKTRLRQWWMRHEPESIELQPFDY